jgi:hypothetical protein
VARFPQLEFSRSGSKSVEDAWLNKRCFLMDQDAKDWDKDLCVRTSGARHNALLWGDSFAAHYIPGLIKNQNVLTHNIIQYTFAGCPPVLSYKSFARPSCEEFNARVFDVIAAYGIDAVVMSSRWDLIRQRGMDGLSETVDRIGKTGAKVYVIGQSPLFPFDVDILFFRGAGREPGGGAAWYLSFNESENIELRAASKSAEFVDPLPTFCSGKICKYESGDRLLFYDYGHLSEQGSDLAVRSYFPLYKDRSGATKGPHQGL